MTAAFGSFLVVLLVLAIGAEAFDVDLNPRNWNISEQWKDLLGTTHDLGTFYFGGLSLFVTSFGIFVAPNLF